MASMRPSGPHLWVALSPHGYGHAAMTAPVVEEVRRRRPDLTLTLQTALPRRFLETRYGFPFDHVTEIADFGLRMTSSTAVDVEASAQAYLRLHERWPDVVGREAERLRQARPDLVLANVPYVAVAAAARAGIPVVALSSLNWADIYQRYLGSRPEAPRILGQMRQAYAQAAVFLRCTPAMTMSLPNVVDIGPVISGHGRNRRPELEQAIGPQAGGRIGLIAFGGIDHDLPLAAWPRLDGWRWLVPQPVPGRDDLIFWEAPGLPFVDLLPSVDVVVTKPGYGTFTEAGRVGTPVLYVPRPDWPESPHLDRWLARHTRCLAVAPESLFGAGLADQLQALFLQEIKPLAQATGIAEAAGRILALLPPGR